MDELVCGHGHRRPVPRETRAASALAGAALVAIVVQSVALAAPTLPLVFTFALACYVIGGAAHGTKNVLIRTLMHQRVPARLHGRAFAAYNALRNGAEMVALVLGGLLIAAIGARWTLFLAGAVPAVAGAVGSSSTGGCATPRSRARARGRVGREMAEKEGFEPSRQAFPT